MKSNFAVTALAFLLVMNLGSGWTQRFDRQLLKIETTLCDEVDAKICTEQLLDAERKCRARAQAARVG